jgi:hypothetical protein
VNEGAAVTSGSVGAAVSAAMSVAVDVAAAPS